MLFNKANLIDGKIVAEEIDLTSVGASASIVTAVSTDYVLILDTSDSGEFKKSLVSDFGGGGGGIDYTTTFIFMGG